MEVILPVEVDTTRVAGVKRSSITARDEARTVISVVDATCGEEESPMECGVMLPVAKGAML